MKDIVQAYHHEYEDAHCEQVRQRKHTNGCTGCETHCGGAQRHQKQRQKEYEKLRHGKLESFTMSA